MTTTYRYALTDQLEVAYLEWNAVPQAHAAQRSAVLLHGWPDSPTCWKAVAPVLAAAGYRVLAPALRGFAPTRFRDAVTPRSGQLAALGRDVLAFVDALQLEQPVLVGHDWGARAAASACALRQQAAGQLVLLSAGYSTSGPNQPLTMEQARNYWYQWFMATPRGALALQQQREDFARTLWDTWAPPGWYQHADFTEAAQAFEGEDWPAVVLHYYRHRWGLAEDDPAYAADQALLQTAPALSVPTLMLHGRADTCTHPSSSRGREALFLSRYERCELEGVGHFPQREAPDAVAQAILRFCAAPLG